MKQLPPILAGQDFSQKGNTERHHLRRHQGGAEEHSKALALDYLIAIGRRPIR